jgi:bacteriorhodopsin
MIDPMAVFATSSTLPIPTVLPPKPIIQAASGTGEKTLWYVHPPATFMSTANIRQGRHRCHGCLLPRPLRHGLPCPNCTYPSLHPSNPTNKTRQNKRLFHILTSFITTFAFISYYAMATGDGTCFNVIHILKEKTKKGFPDVYQDVHRQVYWARYVDWALTTPLLLLDLCFLAGLNGASILVAVVADLIMIVTGLFATFVANDETKKWGYYTWACIAYLVIVYQLVVNGRASAMARSNKTGAFFTAIAGYTLVIWTLYPMYVLSSLPNPPCMSVANFLSSIWGIAYGSRTIGVDSEIIAYAVLDILAKPVFGFWLLFTHDSISET